MKQMSFTVRLAALSLALAPSVAFAGWVKVSSFPATQLSAGLIPTQATPVVVVGKSDALQVSRDNGKTWADVSGFTLGTFTHVSVQGGKVWVGSENQGVAFSTDATTFTKSSKGMGIANSLGIFLVPPAKINDILVTTPTILTANQTLGTYLSTDGGTNWQAAASGLPRTGSGLSEAIQPLYALTTDGTLTLAATELGVYRSNDAGVSWKPSGLENRKIRSIAYADGAVFALVEGAGVFISKDNAATWVAASSPFSDGSTPTALLASPKRKAVLVGSSSGAIAKTIDGGSSWTLVSDSALAGLSINALAAVITPAETLYAATSSGVFQFDAAVADLRLSPLGPYRFGTVQVNKASTAVLTLANIGSAAATGVSIGQLVAPFSVSHNCASTLAVGETCKLSVTLAPSLADLKEAGLTVSARLAVTGNVAVTGAPYDFNGIPIPELVTARPVLELSPPPPFDFGTVTTGQAGTTFLTLKNTGNAPAQFTGITGVSRPFSADDRCPSFLAPGGQCVIRVTYAPSADDVASSVSAASLAVNASVKVAGSPYALSGIPKAAAVAVTKPVGLAFSSIQGVGLSTPVLSNPTVIAGITTAVPISISGGQYSINDGEFTGADGTVRPGQVVRIRVVSSSTSGEKVGATLTVGGGSAIFEVTTRVQVFAVPDNIGIIKPSNVQVQLSDNLDTTTPDPNAGKKKSLIVTLSLNDLAAASRARSADSGSPTVESASATDLYKVFLAALVPQGVLALPQPTFFLKDMSNNYVGAGSPLAAYLENVLLNSQDSTVKLDVLSDFDFGVIPGVEFYLGYGVTDAEMFASGRYRAFYKVP